MGEHPLDLGWVLTARVAVCICIASRAPTEVCIERYKVIQEKVRHCEKSNSKIAKNCTLHYTAVIFQKVRPHKASEIEVGILPKVIRKAKISWKKHYADQKSKNPL